jgi:hypothetical protein
MLYKIPLPYINRAFLTKFPFLMPHPIELCTTIKQNKQTPSSIKQTTLLSVNNTSITMARQGSSTVCYAIPLQLPQPLSSRHPRTQLTSPIDRRLPLLPRHLPPSPRRLLEARLQCRFPNQHPPLNPRMDSRSDS